MYYEQNNLLFTKQYTRIFVCTYTCVLCTYLLCLYNVLVFYYFVIPHIPRYAIII